MRLLVDIIEFMQEITFINFNLIYVLAMFFFTCFITLYVGRVCLETIGLLIEMTSFIEFYMVAVHFVCSFQTFKEEQ